MRTIVICVLLVAIYSHFYKKAVSSLQQDVHKSVAIKTTELVHQQDITDSVVKDDTEYTETQKVLLYIIEHQEIRFKRVVIAQLLHETDFMRSSIFKECNNGFGMKIAYKRKSYATGSCRGHAEYKSIFNSIEDYAEFQKWSLNIYESKYGKLDNEEAYVTFLRRVGYAEDEAYSQKLRLWMSKIPAM